MPGEPKDDPLTVTGGARDGGYSKDTDGVCAEGEEGSTEGREEHDNEGGGQRGESKEGTRGGWRGSNSVPVPRSS